MTLYSLGYDAHKAQWDGTRTDFSSIVDLFGADDARHTQNLAADLKSNLLSASTAYVDLPSSASKRPTRGSYKSLMKYLSGSEAPRGVYETILDGLTAPKCKPLAPLVRALRGIKSEYEVEVMRRAAEISGKAHAKVRASPCLHTTLPWMSPMSPRTPGRDHIFRAPVCMATGR